MLIWFKNIFVVPYLLQLFIHIRLSCSSSYMWQELPDAEWYCQPDCQNIVQIISQLVANGPESLSDSIVSELLESRQHQQGALEMAESSSPVFGWQILHGSGDNAVNGRTLDQAVEIFTVLTFPLFSRLL